MKLGIKRGSIQIPDKVIIDSIGSDVIIKDAEYSSESNILNLHLSNNQSVTINLDEKDKNMNIEYKNKNECFYVDIDFGEAFSVSNDNNNVYIKIRDSYTSKEDGVYFNAILLNTGARCRFDDTDLVIRNKNAKVVINVED